MDVRMRQYWTAGLKKTHGFGLSGVAPHQVEPGHKSVTLIVMLFGVGG